MKKSISKKWILGLLLFLLIAALGTITLLFWNPFSGAGGWKRVDSISAKSFPNGIEIVLPIEGIEIPNDNPDAFPSREFRTSRNFLEVEKSICHAPGVTDCQTYTTAAGFSLEFRQGEEIYCLRQSSTEGDMLHFLLSGTCVTVAGSNEEYQIVFPIHLVSDSRLFQSEENHLILDMEYECSPIEADEQSIPGMERIQAFYEESNLYQVETSKNTLTLRPNSGSGMPFQLAFDSHHGQSVFRVSLIN